MRLLLKHKHLKIVKILQLPTPDEAIQEWKKIYMLTKYSDKIWQFKLVNNILTN
jgi:hypothetical protein